MADAKSFAVSRLLRIVTNYQQSARFVGPAATRMRKPRSHAKAMSWPTMSAMPERSLDQLKATHPDTMDRSITLRTGRAIRFEEGKDTVQLSRDD